MPTPGLIASTLIVDLPGHAPKATSLKLDAWVLPGGLTDRPFVGEGVQIAPASLMISAT